MAVYLHWFRNDLRLHDPAFELGFEPGCVKNHQWLPVYLVNPAGLACDPALGFRKSGIFRAHFLWQSLQSLQQRLRTVGSDLLVFKGQADRVIPILVRHYGVEQVSWQAEHTQEELDEESGVSQQLQKMGVRVQRTEGLSLIYPDDLPFPIRDVPDGFTPFRAAVEKQLSVREPAGTPRLLPPLPKPDLPVALSSALVDLNHPAGLSILGFTPEEKESILTPDPRTAFPFNGGESAGLERLRDYLHGRELIRHYKQTRNGLLGPDYSSKFSPWLANGSLSPRLIYAEVKAFESQHGANQSTYWLIFELLWRDFFRFQAMRHGNRLFAASGIQGRSRAAVSSGSQQAFEAWCAGETGEPFVDANMRELAQTGWMSNRGRQNVASYLVHNLGVDWRMGAAWFEHLLLDYDPASNWGNWQYVAGVGLDPRSLGDGQRIFNPQKQAWQYDRNGDFVRTWLADSPNYDSLNQKSANQHGINPKSPGDAQKKMTPKNQKSSSYENPEQPRLFD